MLFTVKPNKSIFDVNPELNSIREFAVLNSKQMTYVAFASDYQSPFRQLPLKQRKEKAILQAGYRVDSDGKRPDKNARDIIAGKNPKINAAIRKYMDIQYDEDHENINAYDTQLGEIRAFFKKPGKDPDDLKRAVDMMKVYKDLVKTRKDLLKSLGLRDDEEFLSEDNDETSKEVSTLDLVNQENID